MYYLTDVHLENMENFPERVTDDLFRKFDLFVDLEVSCVGGDTGNYTGSDLA